MEWLILIALVGGIWAVLRSTGRKTAQQPRTAADLGTREYDESGQKDSWEGSFWDAFDPTYVEASLAIDYVDAYGNKTQRVVDVRAFDRDMRSGILVGHCRLRDESRTFRFDRIQRCVDAETGEEIADAAAFLQARYDASPDRSLERLIADDRDTLRVLFYVGKADGALRAAERAIMLKACHAMSGDSRITDDALKKMLAHFDIPTLQGFKLAVGRLATKDAEAKRALIDGVEAMIVTQKTVHNAEKDAIEYIRKRFGTSVAEGMAVAQTE